jgi:hypothetical protein
MVVYEFGASSGDYVYDSEDEVRWGEWPFGGE